MIYLHYIMESMLSLWNFAQSDAPQAEFISRPFLKLIEVCDIERRQVNGVTINIELPGPCIPERIALLLVQPANAISDEQLIHPRNSTFDCLSPGRFGHCDLTVIPDQLRIGVPIAIHPHRADFLARTNPFRGTTGDKD